MPVITAIKPQRNKNFVNIFLDGEFSFSLSQFDLVAKRLKVGDSLDLTKAQEIEAGALISKMVGRALNYLSRRPRSRLEIKSFLARKFPEEARNQEWDSIEKALTKIQSLGLVDDQAFADTLYEQRSKGSKAKGWRFIQMELQRKGVAKEIIARLTEEQKSFDWRVLATTLARKKKLSYTSVPREVRRRRLTSFLLRRGFKTELVFSVVDEVLKGD